MRARHFSWLVALALVCGAGSLGAKQEHDATAGGNAVQALEVQEKDTLTPEQGQRDGDRRQGPRRGPWWREPADRAELGITDLQSAKIEEIWQSVARRQRERWHEHEKLEPLVEQLVKDFSADPDHVAQQVERLHQLKYEMNSTRIMMLYRQLRELTPAQREKLKRLEERREAERRKSTDSTNRR